MILGLGSLLKVFKVRHSILAVSFDWTLLDSDLWSCAWNLFWGIAPTALLPLGPLWTALSTSGPVVPDASLFSHAPYSRCLCPLWLVFCSLSATTASGWLSSNSLSVWNPQDLYSVVPNHLWWCFPLDLSPYEHRCSWTLSQPLGCAPDCTLSCCYVLDSLLVFRLQGSLCCPVSWIFQATGRMSSTSSSHLRGSSCWYIRGWNSSWIVALTNACHHSFCCSHRLSELDFRWRPCSVRRFHGWWLFHPWIYICIHSCWHPLLLT